MKNINHKFKNLNFIPLGFLIPFCWMLVFMIISSVLPFGNKSLLYSDGYHQYYPFFKEFRRALLSGESLLYSWNVGMGIDYLGLISYYVASPLNLLSILVPEDYLLYYFTYLTPVRLGLAGLFFSLFIKGVFNRKDLSVPLFASFYALCAWSLGYQWNVMWLDTFCLLPLVALGTYKLLSEKKFFLYTISLFLSVFSNYYIGFFTCIFILLTFICYQICFWKNIKTFIFDLLRIALFSILAIGMTALLELPTFASIQTTQSSVNKYPDTFALNIVDDELYKQIVTPNWDLAKEAWGNNSRKEALNYGWTAIKTAAKALFVGMKQIACGTTGAMSINFKEADALPNIYSGVITLFFSSLFLTCKQIKVRERICAVLFLVFLMISFLVRQLDYIWHGFHFTNMIPYRFSFIYSFIMLYMAYRAFMLKRRFKPWQIYTAALISSIPVLTCEEFKSSVEAVTTGNYFQSLFLTLTQFRLSINYLIDLSNKLKEIIYPIYNFTLILLVAIFLLISSYKCSFKNKITFREKKEYVYQFKKRRAISYALVLCLFCVELIMSMVNYNYYWSGAKISDYPKGTENSRKVLSTLPQTEQFYRTESAHAQVLNDGALNGYNGISTFTSSANVNITRFMQSLGYGAKDTYNRYCYETSSPVADLFLNIKYVIDRDGFYYSGPLIRTNTETKEKYTSEKTAYVNPYYDVVAESSIVALTENNAYLPLGFLCDEALTEYNFANNTDQFKFEEGLIEAATGRYFKLWHPINGEKLSITGDQNVTITSSDEFGKCRYSASDKGYVTYAFTADRSGLFCMDISQGKRNDITVWLNNNHDGYPDERIYSESYSLPQFLSVCAVEPGDVIEVRFECDAGDSSRIEVYGAILDENTLRGAHYLLSQSTYEITSFSNTRIEGTIDCHQNGLMYTSVPQNGENWTVFVDGQPAETTLIGGAMIGVYLTEGKHSVTFQYKNKAFIIGSIVSAVCTLTFISISTVYYWPNIKNICCKIKNIKIKNLLLKKGKYDK